jgi:hypothetical protein
MDQSRPATIPPAKGAAPTLEQRVATLEADVKKPKTKDRWDKLQSISGIVSGLMVALVGYLLTGSVNKALEQRKLELSTGTAVQALVLKLQDDRQAEAEAAAVALAAFGSLGIVPLLTALQGGQSIEVLAAEKGLRALSLTAAPQVCESLAGVLANRTGLYGWRVHRSSIVLLGDLDCRSQIGAVRAYRALLGEGTETLAAYRTIVQDDGTLDGEALALIRETLRRTIGLLERPS